MQRVGRVNRMFIGVLGACLLGLGAFGCAEADLYSSCDLPADVDCQSGGGQARASCAEDPSLQCEVGACGRYEGSAGFCTQTCETDADCPDGRCETFILVSDLRYCVPSDESLIAP